MRTRATLWLGIRRAMPSAVMLTAALGKGWIVVNMQGNWLAISL
jgi:hypothetical protein